jgi:hypothetical protein
MRMKQTVIPGRTNGPRTARPVGANPESGNTSGFRVRVSKSAVAYLDTRPGMTKEG